MQSKKSIRIWECHSCDNTRSCAIVGNLHTKHFKAVCRECNPKLYEQISEHQKNRWLRGETV